MSQKSKQFRFDSNRIMNMTVLANQRLTTPEQLAFAETIRDEIVSEINKHLSAPLTKRQEKIILCALILGKSQGLKTIDIEPICGLNQTSYGDEMAELRALTHSGINRLNLAGKINSRTFFLDVIDMTPVEFVQQAMAVAEPRKYPHEVVAKPAKVDVDNLTGKTFIVKLEELVAIASESDIAYARQRLSVL